MFQNVTVQNALIYAAHAYDNPQCFTTEEFAEDYKRFRYVKRLCRRYVTTRQLKHHLLLNHLVLLVNVFGPEATTRLLFLKCEPDLYKVLKPFLTYLGVLPAVVYGVNGSDFYTDIIPTDTKVERRLQEL